MAAVTQVRILVTAVFHTVVAGVLSFFSPLNSKINCSAHTTLLKKKIKKLTLSQIASFNLNEV